MSFANDFDAAIAKWKQLRILIKTKSFIEASSLWSEIKKDQVFTEMIYEQLNKHHAHEAKELLEDLDYIDTRSKQTSIRS